MPDNDRIARLEQQLAAAQHELALLKGTASKSDLDAVPVSAAFTNAVEKREVSITPLLTEPSSLPDVKQMERLYRAVVALAPWPLDTRYDEHKPFRGFCSSFRWLASKGRTDQPNPKFALSFWLDSCKNWLHDRNSMTGDISATTLILATYASGDIAFCPANLQLGHTWAIGLAEHAGRPASPDGWKRILREGASAILPPSAPARRMPAPSQVRVVVGY